MNKIGRPQGLIRYTSENSLLGRKARLIRPRTVIYSLALLAASTALVVSVMLRSATELELLRVRFTPYEVLEDGRVASRVHLKLTNRDRIVRTYSLAVDGAGVELLAPAFPIEIEPSEDREMTVFVVLPRDQFERGRSDVTFRVVDSAGRETIREGHVLGPLFGGDQPAETSEETP